MWAAVNSTPETKSGPKLTGGRIARHALWAAADNWTQQAGQLVAFLVIGNIVGPELFGIMAMAHLYIQFVHAFLVDGLSEAIVQRKEIEVGHLDAAFWALLVLGILATGLSYFAADLVAAFFGRDALVEVVRWSSVSFIIVGVTSVQQCILRRHLAFHSLAIRSFVTYSASAAVGIVLALRGYGLWSLVIYYLSQRVLDLLMLTIGSRWWPRFRCSRAHLRDLLHFGVHNMGVRVVAFVGLQAERIIVGFFLGATELGLFGMARRIVNSASYALTGVTNSVMLAVLSRQQMDKRALNRTLKNTTQVMSLVTFPAFIGLILVAPDVIKAALRPEWQGLTVILQIISFNGLWHCITFYLGTALRALGRADLTFRFACVSVSVRVVVSLLIVRYGLEAIALSSVIITLLAAPALLYLVARHAAISPASYLRSFVPAVIATLFMAACVAATDRLLLGSSTLSSGLQAVLLIATGVVAYALALLVTARQLITTIWRQIRTT
jgi:PST family polysaccharide transporter